MSVSPLNKDAAPNAIITKSCERGEKILDEGKASPGILMANKGYFLSYLSGIDGISRRVVVYRGPSLFGLSKNGFQEISPYTVRALSSGQFTIINPQMMADVLSNPINRQKLEIAGENDRENISCQIAMIRHNPSTLTERVRDLFDYLTGHGTRPTPVMSQEDLADLIGADRASINQTINSFRRADIIQGGNANSNLPYEVTAHGLETVYADDANRNSVRKDIRFWREYITSTEKQLQLLEARQARTTGARFIKGLWLLTNNGSLPTPRITQEELAKLIATSRGRVNELAVLWEDKELLIRRKNHGSYNLTLTQSGIALARTIT